MKDIPKINLFKISILFINQVKWVYYAKITFENFCTSFGIFVPDVTHTVLQSLWLSSSTVFMQKNVFTSSIILQTMHPLSFSIKDSDDSFNCGYDFQKRHL